ncbi:MAG: hypothetical protein ACF8NJ_10055 [Phycisphaerales bacterium JB038]
MILRRLLRSPAIALVALLADLFLGHLPPSVDPTRPSFAAAVAAQDDATALWLDLPGVVGTAIGLDGRGGYTVNVYVTAAGVARFPAQLADVPLQLVVSGPLVGWGDPPAGSDNGRAASAADPVDPRAPFPRPVPIGVSTGHPGVTAGTIGARVTDGRAVYALSNNHVYANNNGASRGDPLLQPGTADGGRAPDHVLGTLHDFEPIAFCRAFTCPANRIDAALALTTPDDLGHATPDDGYGSPRASAAAAELGMKVQKYGRTTGHTHGQVTGLRATLDISYRGGTARFTDQIVITGTGSGFSAGGDSGSLIVTDGLLLGDRRPVGLLFAGRRTTTIANPIGLVLDRFGVTLDGGGAP